MKDKQFKVFAAPGKGRAGDWRAARGMRPASPGFASVDEANEFMREMKRAPRFREGRVEVRRVK